MTYLIIAFAIASLFASILLIAACMLSSRLSEAEALECEE